MAKAQAANLYRQPTMIINPVMQMAMNTRNMPMPGRGLSHSRP